LLNLQNIDQINAISNILVELSLLVDS